MIALVPERQPLRVPKRRQGAIEEELSTTAISHPPRKKLKRHLQQETNTVYWNSLSRLWLTRRALDELDRRNRQRANPVRTTIARDLDLRQDPLKNLSKQLKRFARHGGPDLRDLGGVSLPVRHPIFADFASTVSRTVHTELHDTRYAIEPVQFEDYLETQKYLERLYCENYNLEDKEDFPVRSQF